MTIEEQIERTQAIIDEILPSHRTAAERYCLDIDNTDNAATFAHWDARMRPMMAALMTLCQLREAV